jgi:hypothetical protein
MTSEGSGEQKCRGLMGEGGCVYAKSGFYFMGIHRYRLPADTSLNLNSITRFVDIYKPTSVCMTYLCSLSPARAGGGGVAKSHFGLEFAFCLCFGMGTRWYWLPADTS